MGSILIGKKDCSFTVKAKHEILALICLFNGKLYLNKSKLQFNKWVQHFSIKYNLN
jgi:hypothetical protein